MKTFVFSIAIAIAQPAWAQKSFSTTYDSGKQVSLQGVVTRIDWVNPNAFFFIDVRDAAGIVTNWAIEFGNPLELERNGWKPSALHIGDPVAVDGVPAARLSLPEIRRALQRRGEKCVLKLQRGSETMEISLTLRDLI